MKNYIASLNAANRKSKHDCPVLNPDKKEIKRTLEILCEAAHEARMSINDSAAVIPNAFKSYLMALDKTREAYGLPKKYTAVSWSKYADSLLRN